MSDGGWVRDFSMLLHNRHLFLSLTLALCAICFLSPALLHAEIVSGTIQDPSGAVIAGARIEITGGDLTQPLVLSSDGLGNFISPDLKPGTYSLRITRDGFEPLVKTLDLRGAVELHLTLAIAQQQVTVSVPGRSMAFANSDPVYRQLRGLGLGDTFRFDNYTLVRDVGTFHGMVNSAPYPIGRLK